MASSIGTFRWIRSSPLGSGSFGNVSLAINLDDGCIFAVKSIPCSPSPFSELSAIENELDILQSLQSPRILRCLGSDYSSENGVASRNLFLEYMSGGSIADIVKKAGGKLDESRVRLYTRGILEGLHYLHDRGIVHCDIKGQNILVGSSGVKIGDFGAAKRLTSFKDEEISASGHLASSFRGTPLWMAPEVVQGIDQGPPSDIWSLGCTVVEMLQGHPPLGNISEVAAVLFRIGCSEEDTPLPEFVSAEAKDFLQKCFQRDSRARWTSADLLKHPFVRLQTKSSCDSPLYSGLPSPKSTLDFCYENEWDDESMNSVPILSLPISTISKPLQISTTVEKVDCTIRRAVHSPTETGCVSPGHSSIPTTGKWITVRCAEGWSEDRQKLFMELSQQLNQQKEKGGNERDLNLERFALLRNRKFVE